MRLAYLLLCLSSYLVAVLVSVGFGTHDPLYLVLQIGSLLAAWFSLRAFLYSFKTSGGQP